MKKCIIIIMFLILYPTYVLATPIIDEISAVYTSDSLLFTAIYDSPDNSFDPWSPGGWCFQIFLDTDQDNLTGIYSGGFEFNVRAIEIDLNNFIHVRRTEGSGRPVELGESTGVTPLILENSFFSLFIPLSFLDGDDGSLDYRLEIYDTIEGNREGTGVTHKSDAEYDGSSTSVSEPATMLLIGSGLIGLVGFKRKFKKK